MSTNIVQKKNRFIAAVFVGSCPRNLLFEKAIEVGKSGNLHKNTLDHAAHKDINFQFCLYVEDTFVESYNFYHLKEQRIVQTKKLLLTNCE